MAKALKDWEDQVKGLLKAELKRRNGSYNQLVEKLAAVGVTETEPNIRNKLAWGSNGAWLLTTDRVVDRATLCRFI